MNKKLLLLLAPLIASTGGCASRTDHMFKPPSMSPVGEMRNPMPEPAQARYNVPAKETKATEPTVTTASLWRQGPSSLFGDRRARSLGDIVTVVIEIDEEAEMKNNTTRSRSGSDDMAVSSFMGLNSLAERVLPNGATLDPAIGTSSSTASAGDQT